jgi:dihydrofolate reductase
MKISIIVAASLNNAIGKDNKLPWHLPADLKYFKTLTTNHCIIMGRNTFESIGKALPNRVNIVLSQDANYKNDQVVVRNNLQDAFEYCNRWQQAEVFIIGGAKVYEQAIANADSIYLTRVETEVLDADTFFPEMKKDKWDICKAERFEKDEKNIFDYTFEVWEKRSVEPIIYK